MKPVFTFPLYNLMQSITNQKSYIPLTDLTLRLGYDFGRFVNGPGARNSVTLWKFWENFFSKSMINRFTCFVVVVVVSEADCMVTVVCDTDGVRIDECRCGGTGAGAADDCDCGINSQKLYRQKKNE